jgi:hypothetical protein
MGYNASPITNKLNKVKKIDKKERSSRRTNDIQILDYFIK